MKKCAQCGSDYPLSNESCPHCGYGANGFANNTVGNNVNQTNNKVIKIVIIVIAVIVVITSIAIFAFSKFIFRNISDLANQELENGFSASSSEECSNKCDGNYVYLNGTCSCMDISFE